MIDDVLLHIFEDLNLYLPVIRAVCKQWYRLVSSRKCSMHFHTWSIWTMDIYKPMLSVWAINYYHNLDPDGLYRKMLIREAKNKNGSFNQVLRYYKKSLHDLDNKLPPMHIPGSSRYIKYQHIKYLLATDRVSEALLLNLNDHIYQEGYFRSACQYHNLRALKIGLDITKDDRKEHLKIILEYSAIHGFIEGLELVLKLYPNISDDELSVIPYHATASGYLNVIRYLEHRIKLDYPSLFECCKYNAYDGDAWKNNMERYYEINYSKIDLVRYMLSKCEFDSTKYYMRINSMLVEFISWNFPMVKYLIGLGAKCQYINDMLYCYDDSHKMILRHYVENNLCQIKDILTEIENLEYNDTRYRAIKIVYKYYKGEDEALVRSTYIRLAKAYRQTLDDDLYDGFDDVDETVDNLTFKHRYADRLVKSANRRNRRLIRQRYRRQK